MSEQLSPHGISFEPKKFNDAAFEIAPRIEKDSLILAETAMKFARVERVPRYDEESRENNAEHSFMLGLVSQEIAARYFPNLDTGLVSQFSIVHDLLELKTGDVATFSLSNEDLAKKAAAEHAVVEELCAELPSHTALLLRVYEEQSVPEARFVRFVDKLLPVLVDIIGPGSKVMHEDYETLTAQQLSTAETSLRKRFERMFPEPEFDAIHLARNGLARKFSNSFKPMVQLQDRLF